MGPVFYNTQLLAASSSVDVVAGASWIYRRLPWPAMLSFAQNATLVGVVLTLVLGSDTQLGPEFPVPAGGTAGVFPNEEANFAQFLGAEGDLITVLVRETAATAPTLNTVIKLSPLV